MKKAAIIILAISAFATLALWGKLFLINQEKEKWEAKVETARIAADEAENTVYDIRNRNAEIWDNEIPRFIKLNSLSTRLTISEKEEILDLAQFLQNEYPELNIEIDASSGKVIDFDKVMIQLMELPNKKFTRQGDKTLEAMRKYAATILESKKAEEEAENAFFNRDTVLNMLCITGSITIILLIAAIIYLVASLYQLYQIDSIRR